MPDPNPAPTPPAPDNGGTPPAPPSGGGTPPAPAGGDNDPVKMAERIGKLETELKDANEFREKTTPLLETLWADQELLGKMTEAHNRRLGKGQPPTPPADPSKQTPPTDPATQEIRTSQIHSIQEKFEQKVGIDKLSPDDQKTMRGLVGQMLKEMVDPKGNKTMEQVFNEVSLVKLPWYLEQAHRLINRDADLKRANEEGKNAVLAQYDGGATGVIGSVPGGSVPIDEVTLTPAEMRAADNMGVPHDVYLKNKKDILTYR